MDLADACDAAASNNRIAETIGYSAAVVSGVLRRSYRGNYDNVRLAVEAHVQGREVTCPGLGVDIPLAECLRWQAEPFNPNNGRKLRMFKACRGGCPNSKLEPKT